MADTMLLEDKLPILARELAMGIYEVEDILRRYGVDWDEFDRIKALPRFQRLVEQITVEWGSTMNTRERIKFKSLAGLEDGLPDLFKAAKDSRETLASRVEAFKLARVLGGIGERDPNEIAPEKFTLTINVGETVTEIGGPVIDVTPGPANLKNTDQLFEFTPEVRAPQGIIRARVHAMTADTGLNDDLTAGYEQARHDCAEE
jgi:hypothetical protein